MSRLHILFSDTSDITKCVYNQHKFATEPKLVSPSKAIWRQRRNSNDQSQLAEQYVINSNTHATFEFCFVFVFLWRGRIPLDSFTLKYVTIILLFAILLNLFSMNYSLRLYIFI